MHVGGGVPLASAAPLSAEEARTRRRTRFPRLCALGKPGRSPRPPAPARHRARRLQPGRVVPSSTRVHAEICALAWTTSKLRSQTLEEVAKSPVSTVCPSAWTVATEPRQLCETRHAGRRRGGAQRDGGHRVAAAGGVARGSVVSTLRRSRTRATMHLAASSPPLTSDGRGPPADGFSGRRVGRRGASRHDPPRRARGGPVVLEARLGASMFGASPGRAFLRSPALGPHSGPNWEKTRRAAVEGGVPSAVGLLPRASNTRSTASPLMVVL